MKILCIHADFIEFEAKKKAFQGAEENIPEGLTIFHFKSEHRRRLRTSNLAERVNREIKRRTTVVNIFSSVSACERLITGVLIEIDEKWSIEQRYLIIDK